MTASLRAIAEGLVYVTVLRNYHKCSIGDAVANYTIKASKFDPKP